MMHFDLPKQHLSWYFFGEGLESFGVDGQAILEPLPVCKKDELLVRVDALGLCASDAKMVRLGKAYPLFFERDFKTNPARLGHETAFTVIQVGDVFKERFEVGQRLGIQPDVFMGQKRTIFGVNLAGAMTQFLTLSGAVLDYVFPVPEGLSYADVALLEPWACVDVAYSQLRRLGPKSKGDMLIYAAKKSEAEYLLNLKLDPKRLVLCNVPESLLKELNNQGVEFAIENELSIQELAKKYTEGNGFDDVILINSKKAQDIEEACASLAKGSVLTLVCHEPLTEKISVDANQLHYDNIAFRGRSSFDISEAYLPYQPENGQLANRSELKENGVLLIYGAGGTMGRMHIQRALMMSKPKTIIAVNRSVTRVNSLNAQFVPLAREKEIEFITLSIEEDSSKLEKIVSEKTAGKGCDDVVVIAPDVNALEHASQFMATDGVLNFFAGVPKGQKVELPLDWVALHKAQFIGTSGSTLDDQLQVIHKTQMGKLEPSSVVAAVGGIHSVKEGIRAIINGRFEGKIVIYPQLTDLPLLSLEALAETYPDLQQYLGKPLRWNARAERALLEHQL